MWLIVLLSQKTFIQTGFYKASCHIMLALQKLKKLYTVQSLVYSV